ncbi:S-adenosyl-L-methionine-dependent methyltransferase [Glomus cerebriforme]|uniref:S-adenosyl-L-methionine-dependent methyltransferase n=1 Tax=Glomus cerebriforme TaxID=658196 RepID=A0A397SQM1_9GLOM|nr:S-adenosyl-L-methionine-dependent methyltransferase [Glomus cerebriforme]
MGNHISTHFHLVHHHKKKNHSSSKKIINNPYRFINGRKYFNYKDSIYPLPVDDEECYRSQNQHFLFHHIWEENFSSPVKQILEKGGKVLDICCGSGTWLLEMATEYRRTEFVGVDMIPIFPSEIKPHNSIFIQYDVLNGLPFKDDEFDLVYIQNSSICFTESQWKEIVIPEMIRVTKPNGWIEFMEVELKIENLPKNFEQLCDAFIEYGKLHNIDLEIASHLGNILQTHHLGRLTDFKKETRKLLYYEKIDTDINRTGKLIKENIISFYHNISPIILPILRITQKEYDEIVDTVNINFEKNKCFNNIYRYYARKKSLEN